MKTKTIQLLSLIFILGCAQFEDEAIYEEKLTVFGSLTANLPMLQPVTVTRSAGVEEEVPSNELAISGAIVSLSWKDTIAILSEIPGRPGNYLADQSIIFEAGETYTLEVSHGEQFVSAVTKIPGAFSLSSVSLTYNCNGETQDINAINTDNYDGSLFPVADVDTVIYKIGECYTQSFASTPFFFLDIKNREGRTSRIFSYALEADEKGMEPYEDANGNGVRDADEDFMDMNRNSVFDSSFVNLVYDTTLNFRIWKQDYLRDENNDPYRINPFVWNSEISPVPMGWLFFNYYGLHLVVIESTDDAYFNYFSGDPAGQNQYRLPNSNIEGGYGLFSSSYADGFFVYVGRDESE